MRRKGAADVPTGSQPSLPHYSAILENIPDSAWLKDADGRYIAVNGPFGAACGRSPGQIAGKTDHDIWPRDLAEIRRANDAEVMRTEKRKQFEERLMGPDGGERWIETITTPLFDDRRFAIGTTGIARDITGRKQAEEKLGQVTRLYAFLSHINQAIVRAGDRDDLFRAICRVAIDHGRFLLAWIGLIDEAAGTAVPAVHAGRDEGYLHLLSIRIGDALTGRGPTGTSCREGVLVVCDDIAKDPRMQPWREDALKRGYRSSASIPFRVKGRIIGSLNLYASEPAFFAGEERRLLTEIGTDISFALDTLESKREHRAALEAAQKSEERHRHLLETLPHGVQENDCSGVITFANRAYHRILGYGDGELPGRYLWDLQPSREEEEALRDRLSALVRDQPAPSPFQVRSRRKDGTIVDLQTDWDYKRDDDGSLLGFISVITDITARKQAEEDLGMRTSGLATLLEVSRGLASTLDLDTVLQATTDGVAKLVGLDTSAVYLLDGETLRLGAATPALPPDLSEEMRNAPLAGHPHIVRALACGEPLVVHDMRTEKLSPPERSIAEQRDLRTVIFIPLIAEKKAIGTLIVGSMSTPRSIAKIEVDLCRTLANLASLTVENARLYRSGQQYAAELEKHIANRKAAEKERLELERRLLHSQKLESLGVLAGGIAHDFNNLLMAILGNLDLAIGKLDPGSPARANVEQSVQGARRATDLTRQILAYSGKGKFLVSAMDLSELVEENAHLFRSCMARTATLDLRLDRPLPPVDADAGQIQQVIMNLITNASESLENGPGTIVISTGVQQCDEGCLKRSRLETAPASGRFVFLEVADTGCGMDEETRRRLFDPFFSTKATGRGLGMSAILGIVRGHHGAIFVDSEQGAGTTIRILFPEAGEARRADRRERAEAGVARSSPELRGTVLVVDDEEIVREVCSEMVASIGMDVMTAADGHDAVDLFKKNADRISHVLLDLSMPRMDGVTTLNELRRFRPGVRIILSSGYNEQDSIRRLSGKGDVEFIQKPFTMQNLREALERSTGSDTDA